MGGMATGICLLLVMAFSSQAMEAASQAARVFAGGVMPALLPMMVLCRLLPAHANHERSAWRGYAGAVFFSFASGSPASAQRVRDLWGAGALARGALEPLLAACGVMGPMFFTGTLAQWTGLRAGCWVLLLCHWTGALAAAGVVRLAARKQPACRTGAAAAPAPGPAAPRPSLPEAVTGAATSLLAVCGAMMTFAIVAGVLRALVAALFPAWTASHGRLLAAAWALLEIGGGAAAVLEAWPQAPMALLCALCSFGGLSIWLQNLLFVPECIRPAKLLCMRMLHGTLSGGLALLIFTLFPGLTRPF